ncbi:DUF418 domain-containing protein [Sphingomonas sp. LB-2]|uniref:DUF418 domain-containing protein n=1 Tax=Sphingomonas caeni TaxID=2984949 RepID=UPI00222EF625|nr:DUF418 domain-containing protein [Sphingomonas caeni]MCW3845893.1 DUF418 domain-containing protein [Sphingomonas caeni]
MAEGGSPAGDVSARLEVVDILRGFALTGLFLVHMIESYELYWKKPDSTPLGDTVYLLFMGKSFSLLALCFGFSFYILMERAARRGVDFTARFAWRLIVLFAIGTLHALIYRGDIIQLLSAMGFVLLLFHRIKNNRLLIALAVLFLAQPWLFVKLIADASGAAWANQLPLHYQDPGMDIYIGGTLAQTLQVNLWGGQWSKWFFMIESGRIMQIMGLYLTGMVLGRIGFFGRLADFAKGRWIGLSLALGAAAILYFVRGDLSGWVGANHGEAAGRDTGYILGSWFELAGMSSWALILCALYQSARRALILPFAALGRLTLTLYILQSLVFVPIFYSFGLGLWDDWSQATRLGVGIGAVAIQMGLAAWWLAHFQYGPIEWVWRALTYMTTEIPFRRKAA